MRGGIGARIFALASVLTLPPLVSADDTPSWVREAAALVTPKYDAKVPAVVLLNEQHLAVDDNGRRTCTTRRAIRILSREGRE